MTFPFSCSCNGQVGSVQIIHTMAIFFFNLISRLIKACWQHFHHGVSAIVFVHNFLDVFFFLIIYPPLIGQGRLQVYASCTIVNQNQLPSTITSINKIFRKRLSETLQYLTLSEHSHIFLFSLTDLILRVELYH